MTNEEAIKAILDNMPTSGYYILREALGMSIEAIEKRIPKKVKHRTLRQTECGGINKMDMKQLFDEFKNHVESLDDDAIRQSIDRATGTYNEDKVNSIFEDIDNLTWYHINEHGEMEEGSNSDCETFYKAKDIFDVLAKYGYHERTMTDEVRNISSNQ